MDCPKRIRNRISPTRAWRDLARERPDETALIRWNLVNRVRAEIAAGTYETPEKLEAALNRMSYSLLA